MAKHKYRNSLPHVNSSEVFFGDVGIGTIMVHEWKFKFDIEVSMVDILKDPNKEKLIRDYYAEMCNFAVKHCSKGFLLENVMAYKLSRDRMVKEHGYSEKEWIEMMKKGVDICSDVRRNQVEREAAGAAAQCPPIVMGVMISPKDGGYVMENQMTEEEAEFYNEPQIKALAEMTEIDYLVAYTMPNPKEAIGIVRAAVKHGMPIAVSFTLGSDGKLLTGDTVKEAVEEVDAATESAPIYYMINCVHLSKVVALFKDDEPWLKRLKGIRGNGSSKSHEELDESSELDNGDPAEYGMLCREIQKLSKGNVNIFMGCCGTDKRHLIEVSKSIAL